MNLLKKLKFTSTSRTRMSLIPRMKTPLVSRVRIPLATTMKMLLVVICTVGLCLSSCQNRNESSKNNENHAKADELSQFKNRAKYGEDISIFVDYGIPSSQPRFFVYDNKRDSLISKSKCAHGCGGGGTAKKPVFSNKPGSECSSLGDYRLRSVDKLNTVNLPCIRIDGLSKTNSNAAARGIVIHEGPLLADDITIGVTIPVSHYISQGCFTISSKTFDLLCKEMKNKKTIYLYAYQSSET